MTDVTQDSEPRPSDASAGTSSARRVLQTIEYLTSSAATASDVARHLGVNRSTALRLLNELTQMGYVSRDPETKEYVTAAGKLYRLIGLRPAHADISDALDPILRELRATITEAVTVGVPAGGNMVYLFFHPSQHAVAVTERLGTVRPMHCSALGRAYLSSLDDADLDHLLGELSYTGGTEVAPRGPIELRQRVEEAREVGYAVEHNETFPEVTCVATPIRLENEIFGALAVSGPSSRLSDDRLPEIADLVVRAAERISALSPGS